MTRSVFDTLSYAKRLKAVGFSEAQAEALADAIGSQLVVKRDRDDATAGFRRDLDDATAAFKRDLSEAVQKLTDSIERLRHDLETRMTVVEARTNLLQWMVGIHIAISVTMLIKVFA